MRLLVPRRAVAAACVGNLLEWYDFAVYAQFAPYIAAVFFPNDTANTKLLKAFLFFGVGFLIRPLGAVVIGNYSDRAGRKAGLTLTIGIMALGTALIAFAPTYAAAGLAAPLVLLLGRLLQGVSAGGEIGGALAYLFESAEPKTRGEVAALLQASMGVSNIVGAAVAFSVTSVLSAEQVRAFGWRIPFLLGLAIIPIGLYLRRTLEETPSFRAQGWRVTAARPTARAPIVEIFSHHGGRLAIAWGISIGWAVAVYVLLIFLPTYVQRPDTFNFGAGPAFGASLIGNVVFSWVCVRCGALSDRVGRQRMLTLSAVVLLTCVLPLFLWLKAHQSTLGLIAFQCAICVTVATYSGVVPAAVAELFPTSVRSSGTALAYNLSFTLFGGFAPAILTWLTQRPGGSLLAPAWYVMLAAVVALVAISFLARGRLSQPG